MTAETLAHLTSDCRYTLTGLSSFSIIMMVALGEPAPAVGALNIATRTFGADGLALPLVDEAPGISPLRSFMRSPPGP
jgi:hypothetical protein